jgi:hypothetical protein
VPQTLLAWRFPCAQLQGAKGEDSEWPDNDAMLFGCDWMLEACARQLVHVIFQSALYYHVSLMVDEQINDHASHWHEVCVTTRRGGGG